MRWGIYKGFLRRPASVNYDVHRQAAETFVSYGVDYHHKLPAANTVTPGELLATLSNLKTSGVAVGLHPLLPTTTWDAIKTRQELTALANVAREFSYSTTGGSDLYLGHEVWRYLTRVRRTDLLAMAGAILPLFALRLYYGHSSKVWARQTEFGWDMPHVVHIAANHGAAADIDALYAAPQNVLTGLQIARDSMERSGWTPPSWYVHLNVKPDDRAESIAAVLSVVARLKPDALIVRVCDSAGASLDCGTNVLEAIKLARAVNTNVDENADAI